MQFKSIIEFIARLTAALIAMTIKTVLVLARIFLAAPFSFLTRIFGGKGLLIYIGYLFGLSTLVGTFLHSCDPFSNHSWNRLKDYNTCPAEVRQTLIDMASLAACTYTRGQAYNQHLDYIKSQNYSSLYLPENEKFLSGSKAFRKDNTIYLVFPGSNVAKNWKPETEIIVRGFGMQVMEKAKTTANYILEQYPTQNLVLVGYTSGGSAVQYTTNVIDNNRITAGYTFNTLAFPGSTPTQSAGKLTEVIHEAEGNLLLGGQDHVMGNGILVRGRHEKAIARALPNSDVASSDLLDLLIKSMKHYHAQLQ